jgi:ABC-2 type transport system ATP-binding protein
MLRAEHLTKSYGDKKALQNLNLEVNSGEIYCLLGANGAGKTTTINLFLGFIQPDSGAVFVDNLNIQENSAASKKRITYIPENLSLYPNLTGLENLLFFTGLTGEKFTEDDGIKALEQAGLDSSAHHQRVSQFSKGMRQKVGIAMAITRKTSVLLLDEPTSGLDPHASNEFARLLQNMKEDGATILMATHDLFRARETGTKVGFMSNGVLVNEINTSALSHSELERMYMKYLAV